MGQRLRAVASDVSLIIASGWESGSRLRSALNTIAIIIVNKILLQNSVRPCLDLKSKNFVNRLHGVLNIVEK